MNRSSTKRHRAKQLGPLSTPTTKKSPTMVAKTKPKSTAKVRKQPYHSTTSLNSQSPPQPSLQSTQPTQPVPFDAIPTTTHFSLSPQISPPLPQFVPRSRRSAQSRQLSSDPSSFAHSDPNKGSYSDYDGSSLLSLSEEGSSSSSCPQHHQQHPPHNYYQTISNTELFYPATFSPDDIRLVEHHASHTINTFGMKQLLMYGHPKIQNAIGTAHFLSCELPARYAQRIELLRDFPFEVNRHPLVQQVQEHYLESLKLVTSLNKSVTTIDDLHDFNKILLELVYQSSRLPSSTLSHALCTAFGDILLQQLMMSVTTDHNSGYSAIPTVANHLKNPDGCPTDLAPATGLAADTEHKMRDALFTVVDDSTASLTLFNTVLQEVLDSFNVSRLDTRLLMTQHCQLCQQLFKHLNIEYDYPLSIDPMAPSSHDEFGLVVGEQVTDFFEQIRRQTVAEKASAGAKTPVGSTDGEKKAKNDQSDPYTGDYGQEDEESTQQHFPRTILNREKKSFSIKDGYDGFVGIIETRLNFSRMVAQIAPYAGHQAASRYAKYTLERSFKKQHRAKFKHLFDGAPESNSFVDQVKPPRGEDNADNSDFEPIANTHSDQINPQLKPKHSKKRGSLPSPSPSSSSSSHPVSTGPHPTSGLSAAKRLEDDFDQWCEELVTLDRDWTAKMSEQLQRDFETQAGNPHPIIPGYQSIVLSIPPLQVKVPKRFYTPPKDYKIGQNVQDWQKGQSTKSASDKEEKIASVDESALSSSSSSSKTGDGDNGGDETTSILIPFPKIRVSGHLDHTVTFPRPHANLIIRELLSNAIENTIKNTLELTKTTTQHLLHDKLIGDYVKYNPTEDIKQPVGVSKGKKVQPPHDDPRFGLVTGNLFVDDFVVLNQHAQLPPIEIYLTKSSSRPKPKPSASGASGSSRDNGPDQTYGHVDHNYPLGSTNRLSAASTESQPPSTPTTSPTITGTDLTHQQLDDIMSIKISDRANGLSQDRATAVLTYGNALIQGHLSKVRQFKQQQSQLNEFNAQVEQMRIDHYGKYGVLWGPGGLPTPIETDPTTSSTDHQDPSHPNNSSASTHIPPFLPPPLPTELQPANLITVTIPTADHYGPNALERLCAETLPPRGFGLPLAKATVHYLHGELKLNSIDGFGTDVYVRLVV